MTWTRGTPASLLALCLALAGGGCSRDFGSVRILDGWVTRDHAWVISRSAVGREGPPLSIPLLSPADASAGPGRFRIDRDSIWSRWFKEPDLIQVTWRIRPSDVLGPHVTGVLLARVPESPDQAPVELYRDYFLSFVSASLDGSVPYNDLDIGWDSEKREIRFETRQHVLELFDRPREHARPAEPFRGETKYSRHHARHQILCYRLTPGGLEYLSGIKSVSTGGWTSAEVARFFGVDEEIFGKANRVSPIKGQWILPGEPEPLRPRSFQEAIRDAR